MKQYWRENWGFQTVGFPRKEAKWKAQPVEVPQVGQARQAYKGALQLRCANCYAAHYLGLRSKRN